jgi:hypothetical protein
MKRTSIPGGISLSCGLISLGAMIFFYIILTTPRYPLGLSILDQVLIIMAMSAIGSIISLVCGFIAYCIKDTEASSPTIGIVLSFISLIGMTPFYLISLIILSIIYG